MADKRNGHKPGLLLRLLKWLGALAVMGLIYVSLVVLQMPDDELSASYVVVEEPEEITRMQSATMNDAPSLAQLFGAPLPYIPGYAMTGQGENRTYDGALARMVTMEYSGVTISAVRPASAAPLLLRADLSVALRTDLNYLSLPAVLAQRGEAKCVYLTGEQAAYAVYAPRAGEEEFLALLERLEWTP